jgi:hypothetical protein
MLDEPRPLDEEVEAPGGEDAEPPLLTKEEAIDEVKRWFEQYRIDPNQIFARFGEAIVRYGDLIRHLEQDTEDGRLLLRAISRGRVIRQQRRFPGLEEDHRA